MMTPASRDFIEHGRYLRNWSPKTIRVYSQSLSDFGETPLTKAGLQAWVVTMRQKGLSAGGINVRIRTVNSFLSWLSEQERVPERLRLRLLKTARTLIPPFAGGDVTRLVNFNPTSMSQRRAWALIMLLLDTGIRIEEALTLERNRVDLEGLMIRVTGKGRRERMVPISVEGRKALYRFLSKQPQDRWVFSARHGRMSYRNAYRDIHSVARRAGLREPGNAHPHAFRHCFAVNYIMRGGDLYRLSRILGHASIATTELYLRSMGVEHLQEGHVSPLCAREPAR